jgi:uncharacterized membrane protein YphA (DoxX/SURF4 family)
MLADHERRALEEIEAGLMSADPTFAQRLGGPATPWRLVLVLTTVTGVCAVAVGLFADRAGLVIFGLLTLATLLATYASWRDRARA